MAPARRCRGFLVFGLFVTFRRSGLVNLGLLYRIGKGLAQVTPNVPLSGEDARSADESAPTAC